MAVDIVFPNVNGTGGCKELVSIVYQEPRWDEENCQVARENYAQVVRAAIDRYGSGLSRLPLKPAAAWYMPRDPKVNGESWQLAALIAYVLSPRKGAEDHVQMAGFRPDEKIVATGAITENGAKYLLEKADDVEQKLKLFKCDNQARFFLVPKESVTTEVTIDCRSFIALLRDNRTRDQNGKWIVALEPEDAEVLFRVLYTGGRRTALAGARMRSVGVARKAAVAVGVAAFIMLSFKASRQDEALSDVLRRQSAQEREHDDAARMFHDLMQSLQYIITQLREVVAQERKEVAVNVEVKYEGTVAQPTVSVERTESRHHDQDISHIGEFTSTVVREHREPPPANTLPSVVVVNEKFLNLAVDCIAKVLQTQERGGCLDEEEGAVKPCTSILTGLQTCEPYDFRSCFVHSETLAPYRIHWSKLDDDYPCHGNGRDVAQQTLRDILESTVVGRSDLRSSVAKYISGKKPLGARLAPSVMSCIDSGNAARWSCSQ